MSLLLRLFVACSLVAFEPTRVMVSSFLLDSRQSCNVNVNGHQPFRPFQRRSQSQSQSQPQQSQPFTLTFTLTQLGMGRAAAVRANTKGKTDAKKAKTNALYGKKVIMAVKQGGSADPDANLQLAAVIKQAKANSVPLDNINRAIKRASESNVGDFSESTFEAYGFGGASLVINVLTDNPNRASADVKSTVAKGKCKIAESGSVLFLYDLKGKLEVDAVLDEEELLEAAIAAGCEDYELEEGQGDVDGDSLTTTSVVYSQSSETNLMAEALRSMGHEPKVSLAHISKAPVECSEDDFEKNMNVIDALEELDDVDSVEHNMSN